MTNTLVVNIDGGSRGNPGPAASAGVVKDAKGVLLLSFGEYLGTATNNAAEYKAAILALRKIKGKWGKEAAKNTAVEFRADSQLLVRQMNGEYKVENKNIQPLFLELWNLMVDFASVRFTAVPREENAEADALANKALDAAAVPGRLF